MRPTRLVALVAVGLLAAACSPSGPPDGDASPTPSPTASATDEPSPTPSPTESVTDEPSPTETATGIDPRGPADSSDLPDGLCQDINPDTVLEIVPGAGIGYSITDHDDAAPEFIASGCHWSNTAGDFLRLAEVADTHVDQDGFDTIAGFMSGNGQAEVEQLDGDADDTRRIVVRGETLLLMSRNGEVGLIFEYHQADGIDDVDTVTDQLAAAAEVLLP